MATTFTQARATVAKALGETLPEGMQDLEDYNVFLADPEVDDQVNLVSKKTGKLHRELYFDVEGKLASMTPITE
jgi:hypothetical protein